MVDVGVKLIRALLAGMEAAAGQRQNGQQIVLTGLDFWVLEKLLILLVTGQSLVVLVVEKGVMIPTQVQVWEEVHYMAAAAAEHPLVMTLAMQARMEALPIVSQRAVGALVAAEARMMVLQAQMEVAAQVLVAVAVAPIAQATAVMAAMAAILVVEEVPAVPARVLAGLAAPVERARLKF
jgi:hypothetical protein